MFPLVGDTGDRISDLLGVNYRMKVNRGRWCRSWTYRGRLRSVLDDAVAALLHPRPRVRSSWRERALRSEAFTRNF